MPKIHSNCPSLEELLLQRSGAKDPCWLLVERHRRVNLTSSTKSAWRHHSACASSRGAPLPHSQELLHKTQADNSKAVWLKAKWMHQWKSAETSWLHHHVEDPTDVFDQHLPREQWTTLNRLRTGVGHFGAAMLKLGSNAETCF